MSWMETHIIYEEFELMASMKHDYSHKPLTMKYSEMVMWEQRAQKYLGTHSWYIPVKTRTLIYLWQEQKQRTFLEHFHD